MAQNRADDVALGDGGDEAQRPLPTRRATRHVESKDPLQQARPAPLCFHDGKESVIAERNKRCGEHNELTECMLMTFLRSRRIEIVILELSLFPINRELTEIPPKNSNATCPICPQMQGNLATVMFPKSGFHYTIAGSSASEEHNLVRHISSTTCARPTHHSWPDACDD